ncbi:GNAT family N-acetyltransferase [Mycobacterium marinum]|uniref:GNAT family N-acetyltransferase n=2 Tax=Mycobacterium marinum TaxID=1781 RepID=UPI0021C46C02|nr:GNAT family N-acetyltransferase [Mycobacterium marinum]MDC8972729.1 GNAT family N-acetyltransferase [Mycobacterium marinum]
MNLSASVVVTHDRLAEAFAIRSAVFMSEQECPYEEEFDGNDFCATHILGFVEGRPAGTMRVRWFAEFAKFERVCVLPQYRNSDVVSTMIELSFDVATRKGFTAIYGHAQVRLVHFWEKFGFKPMRKGAKLVFSDHEYVEMMCEKRPRSDAITLASDPYLLLRPEGAWDDPGVLERSAARPATNPY